MSFSDIGHLMLLPFDEIEPGVPTEAHMYLVQSAAKLLEEKGRNWLPLVVREIAQDQYQVIGNSFVYAVAAEADLEEVWCIIADAEPDTEVLTKVLTQEHTPKTNLTTCSRAEISNALDFLIRQPNSPLKGINHASTVARIDEAPRQYWTSLQPITKLGCRVTAGKKLKALEQVFYLTPKPLPDVITDRNLLESFSSTQLKQIAKKRKVKGYSKLNKTALVNTLSTSE